MFIDTVKLPKMRENKLNSQVISKHTLSATRIDA
jgi:hypothetical protein